MDFKLCEGSVKEERKTKNFKNSISKSEVLFIGDTTHDFEVSNQIGCDCILVSCGHQSKDVLETTNAPVLDKLCQIETFLDL